MQEARGQCPEPQRGKCFKKERRSASAKLLRDKMGTAKGPLGFVTGQSCYNGGARLPVEESRGEDPDMGKTETGIWRSVWRSAWSWGTLFCFFSGS